MHADPSFYQLKIKIKYRKPMAHTNPRRGKFEPATYTREVCTTADSFSVIDIRS